MLSDTWTQKNVAYDSLENLVPYSIRVVPVTMQSRERCTNILDLFLRQTSNVNCHLYLGVYLDDFLKSDDPLWDSIFRDRHQQQDPLIPFSYAVFRFRSEPYRCVRTCFLRGSATGGKCL